MQQETGNMSFVIIDKLFEGVLSTVETLTGHSLYKTVIMMNVVFKCLTAFFSNLNPIKWFELFD